MVSAVSRGSSYQNLNCKLADWLKIIRQAMGSKQSKNRQCTVKPPPAPPRPDNLSDLDLCKNSSPRSIKRFGSTGSSITPISPGILSSSGVSFSRSISTSTSYNKLSSSQSENQLCERKSKSSMFERQLPFTPEVEPEKRRCVVVALENYSRDNKNDLEFLKDDRMVIIQKDDQDWWVAKNLRTGQKGFIPRELVTDEDADDRFEWFHKTDRSGARRLLLPETCPVGTFMIRKKEHTGDLALSIKSAMSNSTHNLDNARVRHYKIKQISDQFCLHHNTAKFTTLLDLVEYYQGGTHGLVCRLEDPCPKEPIYYPLYPKLRDRFEVSRDEFELIGDKALGSGNFGEVWKAVWKEWGGVVAIKRLREWKDEEMNSFLNEAKIMKRCNHKNVVKLHAFCTKSAPYYIVTEFVENGDLKAYLKNNKNIPTSTLINMAVQVASGMDYLSKIPLIHRDLAARNVLVGAQHLVKVADFGMARQPRNAEYCSNKNHAKPWRWTAPEALEMHVSKYSTKSDVWSFGILLIEIITRGQTPYPDMKNYEALRQYLNSGNIHECPRECPLDLYDIMKTCWASEPQDRPDFSTLVQRLDDYESIPDNRLELSSSSSSNHMGLDGYAPMRPA